MKVFIFGLGHLTNFLIKQNKFSYSATYRDLMKIQDIRELLVNEFKFCLGDNIPDLNNYDYVLINIPPQSGLLDLLKEVIDHYHGKLIFISSTSVYGNGTSDESSPLSGSPHSGPFLLDCERFLQDKEVIIIRPGGLVDDKRNPLNFFKNSSIINNSHMHINYVHSYDVARFIEFVISKRVLKGVFNLVSPIKYTKHEFYSSLFQKYNVEKEFHISNSPDRIINSIELDELDFEFTYPDLKNYYINLELEK